MTDTITTIDPDQTHEEPIDVTVEVVEPVRTDVIRHVLRRQLDVGQDLGSELVDVATTVSVAVAHAPATVIGEIRGGAMLPSALAQSGTAVRELVTTAGERLRTAVGDYVGHQATLPSAVVVGASDIAETILRAQGRVAAATINATFTIATVIVDRGDAGAELDRERHMISAKAEAARGDIAASWGRARQEIRGAQHQAW